jgi:hypothetical protein
MKILSGGSKNKYSNVCTYSSGIIEKDSRIRKEKRTMRRYLLGTVAAVAKLKELKPLQKQGLITEAQYQAESQKILNQLVE